MLENDRRAAMRWLNAKVGRRPGWTRAAARSLLFAARLLSGAAVAAEPFQISVVIDSNSWTPPIAESKVVLRLQLRSQCTSQIAFGSPEAHPDDGIERAGNGHLRPACPHSMGHRPRGGRALGASTVGGLRRCRFDPDPGVPR